ncbi:hypothetical protein [Vannielia sp. SX4]|uniref:hypothetical protein n=1 Tax=Vannielia sp. SX4 TaxID=3463852 RepID=UPI004057EE01
MQRTAVRAMAELPGAGKPELTGPRTVPIPFADAGGFWRVPLEAPLDDRVLAEAGFVQADAYETGHQLGVFAEVFSEVEELDRAQIKVWGKDAVLGWGSICARSHCGIRLMTGDKPMAFIEIYAF